ncbi:MAG TPA: pitrilysin family protein [Candidatus Acidoferrum sp.]|nr:pitrilysin family protein [Candidatus Acidoferrum sp.]
MIARAAVLLIPLLLLGACASVEPGRAPAASSDLGAPAPAREVLSNGVVLITLEHRASEVVALQLWMRVGGRDESNDELGLSHYLEHMLFKGTPTRPPGSIDRLIEGLGGRSNAFTSYDYTHYDLVVPAKELRAGVDLLADIAANASFDPGEMDAERKVVLEEMRLTEDNAENYLNRREFELAYEPHPYGRSLLGPPDTIRALTRETLSRYYKKTYVPRHMVLVVVGAVTPAAARAAALATFGRMPDAPAARADVPVLRPLERKREAEVRRPEQQAFLGLAWRTTPVNERDVYAVDLLTYILGDSPSSRLNQTVREQERLVFSIEANYSAWERAGLVTVTSRLDPANLQRTEATILDVIKGVRENGVTEAELNRAIVTAEANYAFDIETAEGLAKTYGQAETTWTIDNELAYLSRLREVKAAEVQAAARKYFGDDGYARVRFVPQGAAR